MQRYWSFGAIWMLALPLGVFFVTALVCHGELARRRPPVTKLTEFYLYVSLGGVLGGIFDALIAPAIFPDIWEYPLLLALSCLARPTPTEGDARARWADLLLPALLFVGLGLLLFVAGDLPAWTLAVAGRVKEAFPLLATAVEEESDGETEDDDCADNDSDECSCAES